VSLKLKLLRGRPMKKITTLLNALFIFLFTISSFACTGKFSKPDGNLKVLHEKTFEISPGKDLRLDTSVGDVVITGWDKSEVYVKILGNKKAMEKMEFDFDNDENYVEIIAKKEGFFNFWGEGINLRFEIQVPATFNNEVHTSGGDIKLFGVNGDNLLKTSGGDVFVKNTEGELDISTSGGDIVLDKNKGNIEASTSGGDIEGRDFYGNLYVSTSGGNIRLKGSNSKIIAETSGGNIALEYEGTNKGIELSTSGGDIMVKLPSDFNASALMSTSGGDISCNLTANNAKKISSTKFEADLNNGGNRFILKTSGGDIVVEKSL
jgi:hypothetical protein